ncbi:hypothetical protein D3C80_1363330 [compost metagenome]
MVRGYNNRILDLFGAEVLGQNGNAQQVIHRNIEEALNLHSMKVHSNDTVRACLLNQVRYQLGRNRITGTCFTVLTRISVVRNYHVDALG